MGSTRTRLAAASLAAASVAALVSGCSSAGESKAGASTSGGLTTLKLWTHNGGNNTELAVDQQIVKDFNASQSKYKVEIQSFPQDSYNDAVTAAAAAKKLPCVLDIDGPNVPNWAWAGYLKPLDLPADVVAKELPGDLGKVNGKIYSFGHYDVALNITARKSVLKSAGIRIPTLDRPWTGQEFDAALAKLKSTGKFQYPLDLGTSGTGEWLPYAYSPILQSFGGDLVDRSTYKSAQGVLNGPAALSWAHWMQNVVAKGYAAKHSGADATADFVNGKTALVYTGSWAADAVTKKYGNDVVFLPPPDFGHGPKIGAASWEWGMTSSCPAQDGAKAYLDFSAQPKYFAAFSKALGLIPANTDAAAQVPAFAPGGKYRVFFDLAKKYGTVRPPTPAYPFIATTFGKAVQDILAGGDPKTILDKATADIDNNIKSNGNYAF